MSTESKMDSGEWPVPCPHEGDDDACDRCWANSPDQTVTPYCTTDHYKTLKERASQQPTKERGAK